MYIFIFRRNLFGYIAGDFFTNPSRHSVTNPIPNHEAVDSEIFLCKEVARGGEQTRVLSILFILSFSPLYRWATAAPHFVNYLGKWPNIFGHFLTETVEH
jgi:hypothetical protein